MRATTPMSPMIRDEVMVFYFFEVALELRLLFIFCGCCYLVKVEAKDANFAEATSAGEGLGIHSVYSRGGSELPIASEEEGSLLPRRANTSLLASTLTSAWLATYPPSPANPINDSDKIPAIKRVRAVPFTTPGTSAKSSCSRKPAISTSARVKPAPAPRA